MFSQRLTATGWIGQSKEIISAQAATLGMCGEANRSCKLGP